MNIYDFLNSDELTKYTYIKTYKAKEIVFNKGSSCNVIGLIESGQINVIELTHTEKEETIAILKDKAYFGDILAFSNDNRYLGHGICFKKTIVRYITKDNLLKLFQTNYKFLEAYLMLLSTKALNLKQENKLFKHKNIEDRIIHYLKSIESKTNTSIISIDSVSDFARTLSLPRPSVSRELTKMERENLIIKKRDNKKTYIILKEQNF